MKRILILGASGFIGQKLAQKLSKTNFVVGYDLFKADHAMELNYKFIQGDFQKEENFEALLQENYIDTIYHLISTTVPCDITSHIADEIIGNVLPTVRLLEAMRTTQTRRIIFASSGGTIYGQSSNIPHTVNDSRQPICSYGVQKLTIEAYMHLYTEIHNLDCRIVRISNPYGVCRLQGRTQGIIPIFLSRLTKGESVTLYGNSVRDYIYIEDVLDALIELDKYDGIKRTFNVGTGIPTRLNDLVVLLEELSGRKFTAIHYEPIRKCDVLENVLDISATTQDIGWRPRIPLAEGILQTIYDMKL